MAKSGRAESYVEREEHLEGLVPHSTDSERAIIGSIFLDNEQVHRARELGLEAEDFYVKAHAFTLDVMYELSDERQEINPIIAAERLRQRGQLEQVGGVTALSGMTHGLPYYSNIAQFAEVVKWKARLRELRKVHLASLAQIHEGAERAEDVLAEAERAVSEVVGTALRDNVKRRGFSRAAEERGVMLETVGDLGLGRSPSVKTGYGPLDSMLERGGLQPQGLYIMAALPKTGKTSLALNIAYRVARRFGEEGQRSSVAYLSMEMRKQALTMRLLSQYAKIPFSRFRPGLSSADLATSKKALDTFFEGLPLWLTDDTTTVAELWAEGSRIVNGPAQCRLMVVDYIQLLKLHKGLPDPDRRVAEVTAISRELKLMAQEWNIPVLAISSLNRDVIAFANKSGKKTTVRPEIWHLRETGQLEYDAEAIFLLHNPDVHAGMSEEDRAALRDRRVWNITLDVAAQRNGPTGDIPLKFAREYLRMLTVREYESEERARGGQRSPEPDFGPPTFAEPIDPNEIEF